MIAALGILLLAGGLVGCGSEDGDPEVSGFTDAAHEYEGPLYVEEGRYGAAGSALACAPVAGQLSKGPVYGGGATSDTPEKALETAVSEGLFLFAPTDEVRLAKADDDRVMLTYEADGRILMALVLRDGPATDGAGGRGWYLEAAARCDFAEFPETFAEKAGYQLWRDAKGKVVPVGKVYSAPGPEHCDWDSMLFLYLDDRDEYVRRPTHELQRFVAGPFESDVRLPADARDTGVERNGRHLWVAADGSYVYVGSPRVVEAWPRFEAGCA